MQNLISGAGHVPKADLSEMHEEKWTHGVLFVLKQFSLQVVYHCKQEVEL